jgi:hypothetical protein
MVLVINQRCVVKDVPNDKRLYSMPMFWSVVYSNNLCCKTDTRWEGMEGTHSDSVEGIRNRIETVVEETSKDVLWNEGIP